MHLVRELLDLAGEAYLSDQKERNLNLRIMKCFLICLSASPFSVLSASVVIKRRKPFHHGGTENTENPVGREIRSLPLTMILCLSWSCMLDTASVASQVNG